MYEVEAVRMIKDTNWRRTMSAAMRRSAAARACPACGRHGALVQAEPEWVRDGIIRVGEVCRWARDSAGRLCTYDARIERPLLPHERRRC